MPIQSSSSYGYDALPLRPPDLFAAVGRCQRSGVDITICFNMFFPSAPAAAAAATPANAAATSAAAPSSAALPPCPVLLLIGGLASPSLFFDNALCAALADRSGAVVIRFDNRDVGRSTFVDGHGGHSHPSSSANGAAHGGGSGGGSGGGNVGPSLMVQLYTMVNPRAADSSKVAYRLVDMARDALGLLDFVQLHEAEVWEAHTAAAAVQRVPPSPAPRARPCRSIDWSAGAHLVGISMGGMIAQLGALLAPARVSSLTLISTFVGEALGSPGCRVQWPSLRDCLFFVRHIPRSSVGKKYAKAIQNAQTAGDAAEVRRLKKQRDEERASMYADRFTNFLVDICGHKLPSPSDHNKLDNQESCLEHLKITAVPATTTATTTTTTTSATATNTYHVENPFTKNNYAIDKTRCRAQMFRSFYRSGRIEGVVRQHAAMMACPVGAGALMKQRLMGAPQRASPRDTRYCIPTVVLQGTKDLLCPPANARYLASCLDGCLLFTIEGLGHVLHPSLRDFFAAVIAENVRRGSEAHQETHKARPPQAGEPSPCASPFANNPSSLLPLHTPFTAAQSKL